jgi:hypothetical protein
VAGECNDHGAQRARCARRPGRRASQDHVTPLEEQSPADSCYVGGSEQMHTNYPQATGTRPALACLAHRLDHRRPPRAYPPCAHPTATGRRATYGGAPAPPAPGRAARYLLAVECPGLRAAGGRSPAALGQERRRAHAQREGPQRASSTSRLRPAPRLETPAHCAQTAPQRGRT